MNLSDLKKLQAMPPWVTRGEAAAMLKVSRQRVTQLLKENKLESVPFLGSQHVLISSIIERLEKRSKIPPKPRDTPQ